MDTNSISEFAAKHRTAIIIGTVVFLLFIVFSVMRFNQIHQPDSAATGTAAQETSPEEKAVAKLNDEQNRKINSYDSNVYDVLSILEASLWATEDKQYLVTFTDKTFTERTADGTSSTSAFVIDAVKTSNEAADDEGTQKATYDLAVETPDTSFFITLEKYTDASGNIQYFLDCGKFKGGSDLYSPISASGSIKVNNLNQDVIQLIDNKQDVLEQQLKEYCSTYYPAAANIDWAKYATIDWDSNTVLLTFYLDDAKSSSIYVEYDRQGKSFEIYGQSNYQDVKTASKK